MSQQSQTAVSSAPPRVLSLSCEDASTPLGVEARAPRLSWQLENVVRQSAYQLQAASTPELLEQNQPDFWDSGRVESAQSTLVAYQGSALASRQRVYWRVRVWDEQGRETEYSAPSWWEMGLLEPTDWVAQWIGRPNIAMGSFDAPVLPAPLFRKTFALPADAKTARAYVCGLGYFEISINGTRVGDHVHDPIVTQYEKRAGYLTHDVSTLLAEGENTLGVMLGNGWYNTHTAEVWNFDKASWRDYPKLLLQLEITCADDRVERIVSDSSWRVSDGPLVFDGLRNGETYDAREEKAGWNLSGYDDAEWSHTVVVAGPGGVLVSQQAPPCRVVETLEARSWNEVRPGVWVFDFGQNLTGWGALRVEAPAGTEISMRYGERLSESGELDQKQIGQFIKSGDCQTDRYICKGGAEELWEPRFTYHGFQYAQVEGLPAPPDASTLRARVVQSDFETAGEFSCSNETLNRLQTATLWSYRGNFTGIPTDCPHREKNGWTGDAQLAVETGLYNFDAARNYAHWLSTLADAQRPSGQMSGIAPTGGWGFNWGNGPAWDSALIVIPWHMYLYRGDLEILKTHYDAMKRYVTFAYALADGGLIRYGLGDWCPPDNDQTAPRDLVTTAILFDDFQIMARVARLLGNDADAALFGERASTLRAAWREEFLGENGNVANNEQTSLGCALYYDLLEDDEKPRVLENLRAAIARANGHPTFGILGAKWIPRVLSDAGHADEAFALITVEGFPGWAHWLAQGASTLWEDWHGESSRNHIMFGDISAWMFAYLGGIRPLEKAPGFAQFLIAPHFVEALSHVRCEHHSPFGPIQSNWQRRENKVEMGITIPANTVAEVRAPRGYRFDAAGAEYSAGQQTRCEAGKHHFLLGRAIES